MTRVKICCIANHLEAGLAIHQGASALGLVSEMPSGPGVIEEEEIVRIAAQIPPGVSSFLLTSRQDVTGILEQQKRCGVNTLQLVDSLIEGSYQELKQALPGVRIVQVIHVTDENAIAEARQLESQVDALLLDSGNPDAQVKELGGTSRVHNWELSRAIVESVSIPVFLAGGLKAENVRKAIETVRPFGVDVCSGIRTKHSLDRTKLTRFFEEVRIADKS